MERLTRRSDTGHAYYPRCFEEPCGGDGCKIKDCLFDNTICERLAKYEDTGLEPDEVTPVVHGWWEREPSSYWRWTSSGAVAVTRTTYRCGLCGRGTAVKSNYCPNCGAKMDGGVDNEAD